MDEEADGALWVCRLVYAWRQSWGSMALSEAANAGGRRSDEEDVNDEWSRKRGW